MLNKNSSPKFYCIRQICIAVRNNELDNNIFPTKSAVTINIGNNGSRISARVVRGICYLYIDMYAADIPALDQYDAIDICTIPEGYRPAILIWQVPQFIDGENAWQGCKFGITAGGVVQLATRWAAISPTENSSRAYTRVFYPIAW